MSVRFSGLSKFAAITLMLLVLKGMEQVLIHKMMLKWAKRTSCYVLLEWMKLI